MGSALDAYLKTSQTVMLHKVGSRGRPPIVHPLEQFVRERFRARKGDLILKGWHRFRNFSVEFGLLYLGGYSPSFAQSLVSQEFAGYGNKPSYESVAGIYKMVYDGFRKSGLSDALPTEGVTLLKRYKMGPWSPSAPSWMRDVFRVGIDYVLDDELSPREGFDQAISYLDESIRNYAPVSVDELPKLLSPAFHFLEDVLFFYFLMSQFCYAAHMLQRRYTYFKDIPISFIESAFSQVLEKAEAGSFVLGRERLILLRRSGRGPWSKGSPVWLQKMYGTYSHYTSESHYVVESQIMKTFNIGYKVPFHDSEEFKHGMIVLLMRVGVVLILAFDKMLRAGLLSRNDTEKLSGATSVVVPLREGGRSREEFDRELSALQKWLPDFYLTPTEVNLIMLSGWGALSQMLDGPLFGASGDETLRNSENGKRVPMYSRAGFQGDPK